MSISNGPLKAARVDVATRRLRTAVGRWGFAALAVVPFVSCSASQSASQADADPVAAQVARGQEAYATYCASCHGSQGEGSSVAPALVGEGALPLDPPASRQVRERQFRTAADVAGFVVENMPPDGNPKPSSADDYWAILGFALTANGVQLADPVGPENAGEIVLH